MRYVVDVRTAPYDLYIGRRNASSRLKASDWRNPFVIGTDGTRLEVLAQYAQDLAQRPELLARLPELRGQVLGCWCAPLPCHGELLAALANELPLPGWARDVWQGESCDE